jgi:hypothetical protein
MGLWDVLRGRTTPRGPNLDSLFAVPGAAITLQTALGLQPTGVGSVCFRAAEGAASAQTQAEAIALVQTDSGAKVETSLDGFGFTWLVVRADPADTSGLVTDLHGINTALELQGFATNLLCSLVAFGDGAHRVGLVYLYKRGTFYPFCPNGPQSRDVLLERQVRDALSGGDLPLEGDINRWLALWSAPGL